MDETLLRCGPFGARDGEGRVLFEGAVLELGERTVTVLEGASGCGKSTLLRMAAGLAPVEGTPVRRLAGREYAPGELPSWRARVTLLAQDAPVLPGSIRWNLEAPFALRAAAGRRFDPERARALLDATGLGRLGEAREARSLSGGERHRLALVRGLLWDPPVLLADEPFSGLDRETAAACWALLEAFARRPGHAALAVLHDPAPGGAAVSRLRLGPAGLEAP